MDTNTERFPPVETPPSFLQGRESKENREYDESSADEEPTLEDVFSFAQDANRGITDFSREVSAENDRFQASLQKEVSAEGWDFDIDVQADDFEQKAEEAKQIVLEAQNEINEIAQSENIEAAELTPEDYREYVTDNVEKIFGGHPDIGELAILIDFAEKDRPAAELLTGKLAELLGKDRAVQLLERGPEYWQSLGKLQKSLETVIGKDPEDEKSGAVLLESADLKTLMQLAEIVGDEPGKLAEAFDVSRLLPEGDLYLPKGQQILNVEDLEDGLVDFRLDYLDSEGNNSATLYRSFNKVRTRDGKERLIVQHDVFKLPKTAQGSNIGKKILENSVAEYEKIGVDEVKLTANIDVGSYAWAKYGFQWDIGHLRGEGSKEKYVDDKIEKVKENVNLKLQLAGADQSMIDNVVREYDDLLSKPLEEKTPQALAELGKSVLVSFDAKTGAVEIADQSQKKGHPIGKIGFFGVSWAASLKLKPDAQGNSSDGLKIFNKYLQKT